MSFIGAVFLLQKKNNERIKSLTTILVNDIVLMTNKNVIMQLILVITCFSNNHDLGKEGCYGIIKYIKSSKSKTRYESV